jgi:biopolymer transport protein ExbD
MDFNARRFNSLFQTTRQDRILRPDINYIPMIDFMIIMVYCVGILTILFSSFNG